MQRVYRSMGPAIVVAGIIMSLGVSHVWAAPQASPVHAVVGDWRLSTHGDAVGEPARRGIFTFRADGSIFVIFQARLNGTGTAEPLWWGEGRWEAAGDSVVEYSMSWPTHDGAGAMTGTVTFDGRLTITEDGLGFEDDRQQSLVTMRNRHGILVASYGADGSEMTAAVTGQRIEVGTS
jgi:hypothetical protein